MEDIQAHTRDIVQEWLRSDLLKPNQLLVVGCSTSEIAGENIGTSGSEIIARAVYDELKVLQREASIELVFQCCEHLNRALVVEEEVALKHQFSIVSVIPVPSAGGSMASYAFQQFEQPVVVESLKADAGIDIGNTLIGMHLKPVAVPLRFARRNIGSANVINARTRPKLIGGNRAIYTEEEAIKKRSDSHGR
ncbi:TIGR01440 family protein [Salirhabdus salicampi]|uniref:TIGR01440 family protein n=1 Tax=Salirhabdus salicampi TaxID=476102 RepID=UPI0020C30C27|nr:TIGR01440 family protein [Salirhabdus salicampi]